MTDDARGRGRPRRWSDGSARKRAHRQRQREKLRLTDDLLHAVRNAQWDEPDMHQRIQQGDDAEVLQALIEHYRQRYFWYVQAQRATTLAPPPLKGESPMPEQ